MASSPVSPVILHADMDAFFASVEQRDRPELRGRPVVVGGSGSRGVVAAASYEARRFGVFSAMPSAQAKQLCPDAIFVRGDMKRYARESRRIFEIFHEFTPAVEGLSLDEAFLDLSGTERLHGPAIAVAERLRERVREQTQLAVSCGIAPVKMVAKIASGMAKPNGWIEVRPQDLREFLDPLPVGKLWGVGPVAQARLQAAGFHSIGDIAHAPSERVAEVLGDFGLSVARLAQGDDVREVKPYREAVSYSEENTFAQDVSDRATLDEAILVHAESVARRLRRDGLAARTVVLKWRDARRQKPGPRGYPLHSRRITLPEATNDGDQLCREARRLLSRAALEEPVRLIGVGAAGLVRADEGQLPLFKAPERARRSQLNEALDQIQDRFGGGAVRRATQREMERATLSLQRKRGEEDEDGGEFERS